MGNNTGRILAGIATLGWSEVATSVAKQIMAPIVEAKAKLAKAQATGDTQQIKVAYKECQDSIVNGVTTLATEAWKTGFPVPPDAKPTIVIAGRVGSGKSTFVNKGLGTTEKTSEFECTEGLNEVLQTKYPNVKFIDMFGVSDDLFIEKFERVQTLFNFDGVMYLYSDGLPNETFLLKTVIASKVPVMVLRNKCESWIGDADKEAQGQKMEGDKAIKVFGAKGWIPISALTGQNVERAYNEMMKMAKNFFDTKPRKK